MNKIKIIAAALAATMMLPFAAACSKGDASSSSSIAIDENSWYNFTEIQLDTDLSREKYDYVTCETVGAFDDILVVHKSGSLLTPADADIDMDYSEFVVQDIEFFDMNGALIKSISLQDYLRENDLAQTSYIERVTKQDDMISVTVSSYDVQTDTITKYQLTIDPATYELSALEPREATELSSYLNGLEVSEEDQTVIGTTTFKKFWNYNDISYIVFMIDENNNVTEFDFSELFPDMEIFDIRNFLDIGNDRALVIASTRDYTVYYLIDINNKTITDVTADMGWFNLEINGFQNVDGIGTVIKDNNGIYAVDYDSQTVRPVFLYENSYVNLSHIMGATPIYITDDKCIFSSEITPADGDNNTQRQAMIIVFEKSDTNPNVGKTMLRLASIDYLSVPICDAICEFNQTNDQYYIRVDNSYRFSTAENQVAASDTDPELVYDTTSADLGSRLAIDLMSGDGPDIIISGSSMPMLNNDTYLVNLNDFVTENFTADAYFTNVFDAAKTGDAIYQLPLAFEIYGIMTSEEDLAPGQVGFTFEQFRDYVAGPCNGVNPVGSTQMDVFLNTLSCMQDQVIIDGHVSYNNPAFTELAQYTAESVTDELVAVEGDGYDGMGADASTIFIRRANDYYGNVSSGKALVGLPSPDGRGPVFCGSASVGISATSQAVDGCKEFIKILMSESIQEKFGVYEGLSVNRTAFHNNGIAYMNSHNTDLEVLRRYYTDSELISFGWGSQPMQESDVDAFTEVINNMSGWQSNDGAINAIIREEMPAYFAGQKTLDQVIPVLEDRAQTVLSERLG